MRIKENNINDKEFLKDFETFYNSNKSFIIKILKSLGKSDSLYNKSDFEDKLKNYLFTNYKEDHIQSSEYFKMLLDKQNYTYVVNKIFKDILSENKLKGNTMRVLKEYEAGRLEKLKGKTIKSINLNGKNLLIIFDDNKKLEVTLSNDFVLINKQNGTERNLFKGKTSDLLIGEKIENVFSDSTGITLITNKYQIDMYGGKGKMIESKLKENFSGDVDKWFGILSDAGEKKQLKSSIIELAKDIKSGKIKPTKAGFDKFYSELQLLPPKIMHVIDEFIDNIEAGKYNNEFKNMYGNVSQVSELLSMFQQAVLYYESTKLTKKIIKEDITVNGIKIKKGSVIYIPIKEGKTGFANTGLITAWVGPVTNGSAIGVSMDVDKARLGMTVKSYNNGDGSEDIEITLDPSDKNKLLNILKKNYITKDYVEFKESRSLQEAFGLTFIKRIVSPYTKEFNVEKTKSNEYRLTLYTRNISHNSFNWDILTKNMDKYFDTEKIEDSNGKEVYILKNKLKESKLKEYDYADKKVHIIGVSLDGSKNIYLLGFKTERNAEEAKDYFENISDVTTFIVDYYGEATMEKAENYFSKNYKVVAVSSVNTDNAIKHNPSALVQQVYRLIK